MTPMQMARFYAMIANGGQLVTPHIAAGRRAADERPECAAGAARASRRSPPTSSGVDPAALSIVQQGLFEATHSPLGTSYGRLRRISRSRSPARRAPPRSSSRCPASRTPRSSNQSWWCGYGPSDNAVDRRLRRDRERRPRRHRGRAGGAEGVRAYFHKRGPRPRTPTSMRLMAIEAVDTSARGLRPPRDRRAPELVALFAPARLVAAASRCSGWSSTGSGRSTGSRATIPAGAPPPGRRSMPRVGARRCSSSRSLIDPAVYRRFSRLIYRH